jgi:predicted DCC family thiol-disulfide oxidoreductase YuxK
MEAPDTLIYDHECLFCSRSVEFIRRYDREGRYRFLAMNAEEGIQIRNEVGLDGEGSVILVRGGNAFTESCAIIRILSGLGGFWVLANGLYLIPRTIRNLFYRFIARNRYRFFGRRTACVVSQED